MKREDVIKEIEARKLIVIARGFSREELLQAAEAMYEGGVRLMEVTYNACGDPSDEVTAQNIAALSEHFKGRMYIGAGTVLTEKQVELTAQAGGRFIISPDSCEAVIRKTRELGLVSIPGAFTPTEAMNAHRWGADFIKIFPTTELSPSYFRALSAPLSQLRLLAVGGVNPDNLGEYLSAGAVGIGVAGGILKKEEVREGRFAEITALAKRYCSLLEPKEV